MLWVQGDEFISNGNLDLIKYGDTYVKFLSGK